MEIVRVLERSAPRSGAPERRSETRSAAGAPLIKLRRSATRSGAPQMAGALPGAQLALQRSERYKIVRRRFQKFRASRELRNPLLRITEQLLIEGRDWSLEDPYKQVW